MLGATEETFYLTNILPQLSFVYIIAFLLMQKKIKWQLTVAFAMMLVSDLLYRFWPVAGFNMPYVPGHNFGSWFDMVTVGHLHPYHWVTFNAIPTCAHIIWGVCTGKLLMTDWSQRRKLWIMVGAGLTGVIAGYVLGLYIPMIERISTSSFVLFSGGWCLLAMAFSYWLIDIMNMKRCAKFFAIVGMNPIFIYLFVMLGGRQLLTRMAVPFTSRIFSWSNDIVINMVTIIVVAAMVWYISYFLYKRKIFIKL
jgi:predicted acyltransferase